MKAKKIYKYLLASILILGLYGCDDEDIVTDYSSTTISKKIQLGVRPFYLVDDMDDGALKSKLQSCKNMDFKTSNFSIGHRGAPLQFPEHTRESYIAASQMGAGIIECDVAFTKDRQLVCRHAQNDLHTSTNILLTPLASKCAQPFVAADKETGQDAQAECRTSDITLAEFKTLRAKMDGFNPKATTVEEYVDGTEKSRTDLYAANSGTLMTHIESIQLIKSLGAQFTPELKTPVVQMPFEGDYTQEQYASQMLQDYLDAGVDPKDVFPQSFLLDDIVYWVNKYPEFAQNSVFLDESDHTVDNSSLAYMQGLHQKGVRILAPALWKMLTLDADHKIIPSKYAENAKAANLQMIGWTLERSGPLNKGGGWYYQSIAPAIKKDGDMFEVIDVLAKDVGVIALFSDWPATTTFYANCMGLK